MDIILTSSAFQQDQPIPVRHTGDGRDVSPPLAWTNLPEGTKELALICDDPDAPTAQPWVHWVICKIAPDVTGLDEGVPRHGRLESPPGALQGSNSWNETGYRGPAPPPGHGVHHYHFRLYGLDAPLEVGKGPDKPSLLVAMEGHVLATGELVGTYRR